MTTKARLIWKGKSYEKVERNAQIILLRLDKQTYAAIAEKFNISLDRVRQIVNRHRRELMNRRTT